MLEIFLSSTFRDLKDARSEVIEWCLGLFQLFYVEPSYIYRTVDILFKQLD